MVPDSIMNLPDIQPAYSVSGVPVVADGIAWAKKKALVGSIPVSRAWVVPWLWTCCPRRPGGVNMVHPVLPVFSQALASSCLHGWDLAQTQEAKAVLPA